MFDIKIDDNNEIVLSGRFDASQTEKAATIFNEINKSCIVNLKDLDYISSTGLGVLLKTQKRLNDIENELTLKNLNNHIQEIFKYSGFDMIFKIE